MDADMEDEGPAASGYMLATISNTYKNKTQLALVGGVFALFTAATPLLLEDVDAEPAVSWFLVAVALGAFIYGALQWQNWKTPSSSPVWQEVARYGDPAEVLNGIEDEIRTHGRYSVGSMMFSRSWFVRRAGTSMVVVKLADIARVKSKEHKSKKVGVTLMTNYWVTIRSHDAREWEFIVPESQIVTLIEQLEKRAPGADITEVAHRGLLGSIADGLS